MDNWKVWQNCLLHTSPPHYDRRGIHDVYVREEIQAHKAWFARYTTDWDCGYRTEWWYCIKDTPINPDTLTAKTRYRIKKGLKNIEVRLLSKTEMLSWHEQIKKCFLESFEDYPVKYRPRNPNAESFVRWLIKDESLDVWIGVSAETNELCGFATCKRHDDYIYMVNVKVPTRCLKTEINAALGYRIVEYYLNNGEYKYICDGERNIRHETQYQDFLVRVLGFRYAYCKLRVIYSLKMKWIIQLLFPIRKLLWKCSDLHPIVYNVACVLKQEEIARAFR